MLPVMVTASRPVWGLFDLDPLLLSPCLDATQATREVSEDLMLEEAAASFAGTSVCTCATSTVVSHPAHLAPDLVPPPLEHGQSQVTPPQAA